ncbi:hypothetical protein EV702DRAFT_1153149 [Suillus placidus]|uniref:Uncharacterized protein n=1 Tax=Suillus placidus TaxID=48579 RepID=A0A9P6ZGQ0_9AGAM|nr:hypothetical protein EV702DRAFT_1153149 [Suillus placidus]
MLRAFPKQHTSESNNSCELIQVTYQKLVSPSLTEVEAVAAVRFWCSVLIDIIAIFCLQLGGLVIKYRRYEFKVKKRWILKVPITPSPTSKPLFVDQSIGLLSSQNPQPVAHGNPLGSPISLDACGTSVVGLVSNGPTTIFLTMTPSTAEVWRI